MTHQARHATSRNSGTPVAIIRSPTQRMGDALNALRPQRLRTKAASSLLPHWLDGYSECNSCSSRVLLAHVESANCPVAYQGLKITTSLSSVSMIFSVCEKNKRRYAAIESEKLSHGGVNSISALLECDPKTIRQGKKELTELELDITGIRQPGGGRKKRPLPLNTVE